MYLSTAIRTTFATVNSNESTLANDDMGAASRSLALHPTWGTFIANRGAQAATSINNIFRMKTVNPNQH